MSYELTQEEIENNCDGPEVLEIEYHCFDCGYDFVTGYSVKYKCEKCDSKNINRSETLG